MVRICDAVQHAHQKGVIHRYLNHEPIAPRPPSSAYQLRKFARRNRAMVTGVVAAFVALLAGGVVASWQAVRATRAERRATASAPQATREADEARAEALEARASLLHSRGNFAAAEPLYREYVQSALVELPPDHAKVEQGSIMLAANLIQQSKWAEAEATARERMAACDKTHPKSCASCAMLRLRLGTALAGAKRFQEALTVLTDAWTRMDADPMTAPARKRAVAEQLLAVSEALGNADQMTSWRERLEKLGRAITGG